MKVFLDYYFLMYCYIETQLKRHSEHFESRLNFSPYKASGRHRSSNKRW